jgi:hypothetical protein
MVSAVFVVHADAVTRLRTGELDATRSGRDAVGATGIFLTVAALSAALPFDRGYAVTVAVSAMAVVGWALFERTRVGLLFGIAVAAIGTLCEMLCVRQGWFLYPEVLRHVGSVPAWVPANFFSGGVAVAQTTRAINCALRIDK